MTIISARALSDPNTTRSPRMEAFPLMERPAISWFLAVVAGLLNAWTFHQAGNFATIQSGNVLQMGYQLAAGDWPKFWYAAGAVLAFGLGSAFTATVIASAYRRNRDYSPLIQGFLLLVMGTSLVLTVTGTVAAGHTTLAISFAGGMQGNAFHRDKGMLYANVAMTLVLQNAFNYLAQAFFTAKDSNGRANLQTAATFFFVLLGFAGGCAVGFLADQWWSGASLTLAMAITAGMTVATLTSPSDPDPVH